MTSLLKRGMTGNDIAELQAALNFHVRPPHVPLAIDGIFGPLTEARTILFQELNGLLVDGICGPQTRGKLYEFVSGQVELELIPIMDGQRSVHLGARQFQKPLDIPAAVPPPRIDKPKKEQRQFRLISPGPKWNGSLSFDPFHSGTKPTLTLMAEVTFPWPNDGKPFSLQLEGTSHGPADSDFEIKPSIKVPFFKIDRSLLMFHGFFKAGAEFTRDNPPVIFGGVGAGVRLKILRHGRLTLALGIDGETKLLFKMPDGPGAPPQVEHKGVLQGMLDLSVRF